MSDKIYDGKNLSPANHTKPAGNKPAPMKAKVPDPGKVKTEHDYNTTKGSLYTGRKAAIK